MARRMISGKCSHLCETWVERNVPCGKPAVSAYPAQGGGWHSMCAIHGEKHRDATVPIEQALQGIYDHRWATFPPSND